MTSPRRTGHGLSRSAFGLLCYLRGREDVGPSLRRKAEDFTLGALAEVLGDSRETVSRALRELAAVGWVRVEERSGLGISLRCIKQPRPEEFRGDSPPVGERGNNHGPGQGGARPTDQQELGNDG